MIRNVGSSDKIARYIIATGLILLYVFNVLNGIWGVIALIVAAVLIITSLVSFCGAYALLGMNTCKVNETR